MMDGGSAMSGYIRRSGEHRVAITKRMLSEGVQALWPPSVSAAKSQDAEHSR